MAVDYYCLSCKRHIDESDVRTVIRVGRGGAFGVVIHREPCGGDTLYYEPADDAFYVPIPEGIVDALSEAQGDDHATIEG